MRGWKISDWKKYSSIVPIFVLCGLQLGAGAVLFFKKLHFDPDVARNIENESKIWRKNSRNTAREPDYLSSYKETVVIEPWEYQNCESDAKLMKLSDA